MISREIFSQAILLASCLGLGGWLMLCYDLLRISRLIFSQNDWLVGLEDFFYWIYVSLSVFSLLYRQNDGIVRGYVILGVFLGMAVYDRIISRNLLKVLQKLAERIKINLAKRKKQKKSRKAMNEKDRDKDEIQEKAIQRSEEGQVGQPDGTDRSYCGRSEPGCGTQRKEHIVKRKRFGISGKRRKSGAAESTGRGEKDETGAEEGLCPDKTIY